ncbi:hypothetical protein [Paenibacillus xylanexedens]|uniref:hypothetical protein n=1 Tax=Paenibacillus xylanexedens TaxID=528191 RepID=UPI0011A5E5F8|nr:hypothetical protein [Paenibacillus xylanexedens]
MKVSITRWYSQQNQETYMQIAPIKRGLLFNLAHTYEALHAAGAYAFVMENKQLQKLQRLLTRKRAQEHRFPSSLRVKCNDDVKRKLVIRKVEQVQLGMQLQMDDCTLETNGEDLAAILRFITEQLAMLSGQEDEDRRCQERVTLYSPQTATQFEYEIIGRGFHIVMMQKQFIEDQVRGGAIYEFHLDIQDLLRLQTWMEHSSFHPLSESGMTIRLSDVMDIDLNVMCSEEIIQFTMIKKGVNQCQFSFQTGEEIQQFGEYIHEAIYRY